MSGALGELRGRVLWVVIGCLIVQLGLGYGYAAAPLSAYLLDEFGWSRAQIASARTAQPFLLALSSPLVGFLTVRFGARFVLASGAVVLAATFMLSAGISTFTHLVAMWVAQGLSVTLLGDIAVGSVVSRWTERSRALALGIAYTGANLGGFLAARALVAVAEVSSWRVAMLVLGAAALVVVLPAALWLVRDREAPSAEARDAPRPEPARALPLGEIMASRSFWILLFAQVSYFLFFLMVLESLVLMLEDQGYSRASAAGHLANATLVGGFAKVGFGFLALRMTARHAMILDFGLLSVSAVLLLALDQPWAVSCFVFVFGVGYAARDIVTPLVIVDCFGVGSVAQIYGLLMLGYLVSPLGGVLAGFSFDKTGSYEPAIMGIGGMVVVSFGLLFALPKKPRPG